MGSQLDERSWQLLQQLIRRYIHDGQPVSSKTLSEVPEIALSSATVRHVMADLEQCGYVVSPHTSAGRIPTEQGYRLFVDHLLTTGLSACDDIEHLKERLEIRQSTSDLLKTTSELLSDMTHCAGLVTVPKHNHVNLEHIEFISLNQKRVLVILVFSNNDVQNRIIHTDRSYTAQELQRAAAFLNQEYLGKDLMAIRAALLSSMQQDRKSMDDLMHIAIVMADQALKVDLYQDAYLISGQSHLLNRADMTNIDCLQALFEAFKQKQILLGVLNQCIQTDSVQIFIGKEAGSDVFDNFSFVTAPYMAGDEVLGVLGVIGPTRMPYDKVISVVDMTAKMLTSALKSVQ
ncbi:MAG: heat-inducible transcriptional repressor HrcA [Pseudomonadota bacterium]